MFLLHASFDTCTRQRWFFYVDTVNEWRSNASILKILSYLYCHWQTFPASFKLTKIYITRVSFAYSLFLSRPRAHASRNRVLVPGEEGEGGTQKSFIQGGSAPRSDPLPFDSILQQMESLPSHISEAWKSYPFQAEPPRTGHYREYPPPRPSLF